MPKARNKKYNPNKARAVLASAALEGLYVVLVDGQRHAVYDSKNDEISTKITPLMDDYIRHTPHTWSALVAVQGRTETGEEYQKAEVLIAKARYYYKDLASHVRDLHVKVFEKFNKNHLVNCGWIASPSGEDICEKFAAKVFDKFKAWDFPIYDEGRYSEAAHD